MPYCPSCRGEFRDEIEWCQACDAALVAELGPDYFDPETCASLLESRELAVAATGPLLALKDLRRELARDEVPCVIGPPPEQPGGGKSCSPKLGLYVAAEDVPRARLVLDRLGDDDVVSGDESDVGEGSEGGGASVSGDACPACGTRVSSPGIEECPECGLFLGAD